MSAEIIIEFERECYKCYGVGGRYTGRVATSLGDRLIEFLENQKQRDCEESRARMNDEIIWLKKFDAAMTLGRNATASLNRAAMVQHEAGNQALSAHLYHIAEAIEESLGNANGAISQMISEEVKASSQRLNETFLALLKNTLEDGAERGEDDG